MSAYRIELRPAAARALRTLDTPVRRRVQGAIALLAQDPRPPGARALQGRPGLRVRVVDHRISCTVEDDVLLVVVVRLGHRRHTDDEEPQRHPRVPILPRHGGAATAAGGGAVLHRAAP